MNKKDNVVWLVALLFVITSVLNIIFSRSVWFDTSYSLEIANRPLSYFTWSQPVIALLIFLAIAFFALVFVTTLKNKMYWSTACYLPLFGFIYYALFIWAVPKDVHPPLSYILFKFWAFVFGWSVYSARIFTLLFGLVGIIFLYKIVESIYDQKTAIYMLVPMAFLSSYVQYFTEVRMYSMYFCFSVMSFYFLIKYFKTGYKFWIVYYFLSLLPYPYTHWFMIYPFLMQLIYIFIFKREFFVEAWDKFLVVFALWFPAVLYFLKQVARLEGMWLKQATIKSFFSTIHYFFFHSNTDMKGNIENWIGYGLVLLTFLAVYLYVSNIGEIREKKYAFFFMLYALLPPVIGLVIQRFWNVYHHRYFVFMGWAFILLLVRFAVIPKKKYWVKVCSVIFTVSMLLVIGYQAVYYVNTTAFELRDMNDYVRDNYCNSEYALLHESPFSSVPAQYYMRIYGCNNTNWIHSDLPERLFRSAGGDVIPMETRLNSTDMIIEKVDKGLYFSHKDNLLGPEYETEILLEFDGINLVKFDRIESSEDSFGVMIDVR